jgi:hypothetical protein
MDLLAGPPHVCAVSVPDKEALQLHSRVGNPRSYLSKIQLMYDHNNGSCYQARTGDSE